MEGGAGQCGRTSSRRNRTLGTFTGGLAMRLSSEADVTLALIRSRQVETLTSDPTDVLLGALVHIWPANRKRWCFKHTGFERDIFLSGGDSPIHLDLPCINFL